MHKLSVTRQAVLAAAGTGDYPLSGREWVDRSGAAIGTILKLANEISTLARAAVDEASSRSLRKAILYVALMLGGMAVCVGASWLVTLRVINPITAMTVAMKRLAEGDKLQGSSRNHPIISRGGSPTADVASIARPRRYAVEDRP